MYATSADDSASGIFGYVNYLVEKDRKFILDTLVNGEWSQLNVRTMLTITRSLTSRIPWI